MICAVKNYRTWVLTLNYGYCFGVELTLDNIVTQYLADQFGLDVKVCVWGGGGLHEVAGPTGTACTACQNLPALPAAAAPQLQVCIAVLWPSVPAALHSAAPAADTTLPRPLADRW